MSGGDSPHPRVIELSPVAEVCLEATDEHEPEAHESETEKQHGTTAPFVNVNDGRDLGRISIHQSMEVLGEKRGAHW